jgi:hypothetical protein
MANLSGQNIGTNYKGILNLNTLNGNLSGTLQAVTDGDGNASPLQLSTGKVQIDTGIFEVNTQFRFNQSMFNTIDDIVKIGSKLRVSDFIQFNGATNGFPMIKRNTTAIDFRLADDSAFCNIRAGRIDLTGALLTGFINDATNAITAISIANTTGKTTFSAALAATALPTTRPATVGDLYVDTAANILANGDKVVGIRV